MRLLVALGGNALLRRNQPLDIETLRANMHIACKALAPLAERHNLIITHGNGPQIDLLAQQALEANRSPYPLDVLGAQTEGMIGYLLEQELRNLLPEKPVTSVLTQTLVDSNDKAFQHPTKFVGKTFEAGDEAWKFATKANWAMKLDGARLRCIVPSPQPKSILELDAITTLSDAGSLVICASGVPVARDQKGLLHGIEGVVDEDLTSALLARDVKASALLMLTDVGGVYSDWDGSRAHVFHQVGLNELNESNFEPGSMGPKVKAARQFVRETGCIAAIGATEDAMSMYEGKAGTIINPLL